MKYLPTQPLNMENLLLMDGALEYLLKSYEMNIYHICSILLFILHQSQHVINLFEFFHNITKV